MKNTAAAPIKTIRLSEITPGTILHRIAAATIDRKGEYGYTDATTGEKVRVIR